MQVLLVEDDKSLSMAIAYRLKKEGLHVTACLDGVSGLAALEDRHFNLILLDRMLPGHTGDEILRELRSRRIETPVLMLTAMDRIDDRVAGLDAGADDYLIKPFAMDELMARLRALSRRQPGWHPQNQILAGDLVFDADRLTLTCTNQTVILSRREGTLMEFLLRNQNQVLPRTIILDRVWHNNIVEEGNLDIYIHFLRKHLAQIKSKAKIKTIRGIGYQLVMVKI